MKIRTIPVVDAADMPTEVLEYCIERGINIHGQHDIARIENDDNPFARWLKENGFMFPPGKDYAYIGIFAT